MADFVMGFLFSVVAGLATVLGCAFIPLAKMQCISQEFLTAGALAFAAGVMLWVSFVDVLGAEAVSFFEGHFTEHHGAEENHAVSVRLSVAFFFFLGIAFTMMLDVFVAHCAGSSSLEAPREVRDVEMSGVPGQLPGTLRGQLTGGLAAEAVTPDAESKDASSLRRVAIVAMIALTLHNFPEGLATFFDGSTGSFTVALAIAMHNIPEGAAVAIPAYQSSGSFAKAFLATFVAGLAQPLGALLGWMLILLLGWQQVPSFIYGAMYSSTAGIMVAISLVELFPEAVAASSPRLASSCAFAGFMVMELSIVCLDLAGV